MGVARHGDRWLIGMVVLEIDGGGIWLWWSSWRLAFTMKVGMVGFDFKQ